MSLYFASGKKDSPNIASLKDLMKTPPMTAEQYLKLARKRTEQRRMIESTQEWKSESKKDSW